MKPGGLILEHLELDPTFIASAKPSASANGGDGWVKYGGGRSTRRDGDHHADGRRVRDQGAGSEAAGDLGVEGEELDEGVKSKVFPGFEKGREGFRLSSAHDGELVRIECPSDGLFALTLRTTSKEELNVVIREVVSAKAANFRQGNLVLDVVVVPSTSLTVEDARFLLAHDDGSEPVDERELEQELARLRSDDRFALRLDSSYGCRLLVVFRHLESISVI